MTNIYCTTDIANETDFLKSELLEEKSKMLQGKENHYSYLFMILNDIGITD